jgi:hypothetical protein
MEELQFGESIDFTFESVDLSFSNEDGKILEGGKLIITNKRFLWSNEERSFTTEFVNLTLHAISHDTNTFPKPCVYCQFDIEPAFQVISPEENEDEDNDDDVETFVEIYVIPRDIEGLKQIFNALSLAVAKNPVDDEDDSDDEGLEAANARTLEHIESIFKLPEDANI